MINIKNNLWGCIDDTKEELLNLCSDLIKTPSINPGGDIEVVTKLITNYLEEFNIEYEIVRPREDMPNIIAKIGNENGKKILLNGHSDVVPVGNTDKWDFDPFSGEIVDGKLRGRGTSDMKCGLAGLMYSMKLLKKRESDLKGQIILNIVPDEETGGEFGTLWLYENGYFDGGHACIIGEPTSYNNCEVGQKGSLHITLKSYGIPAHGSIGNYVGDNAILNISKLFLKLDELRSIKGYFKEEQKEVLENSKKVAKESLKADGVEDAIDHVTVNIGTISGGTKSNVVADYCEAELDIRVPIGCELQTVIDKLDNIIEELQLKDKIKYEYDYNSPANYTDANTDLVKSVVKNAEHIWKKTVLPAYQWASSDARYYRAKDIPTIQYGPANTKGIHSYNEDVDVEDIINSTKVYVGILVDLLM